MAVTVITPGKLVKVTPDELDVNDILDFGAAIIEEQGHKKGDGGSGDGPWSIHGAIGEAARRATGQMSKGADDTRPLRDEAAERLAEAYPDMGGEIAMNDRDDVDQARAVELMRGAIRPFTVVA